MFTSGQIIYENKNFGTNSYGCATFFLESDYRRINIQEKRSGPSEIMGHISVVDFIYIILNRTKTLATQAKGVLKVNGQGIFACWLLRLVSIFF